MSPQADARALLRLLQADQRWLEQDKVVRVNVVALPVLEPRLPCRH